MKKTVILWFSAAFLFCFWSEQSQGGDENKTLTVVADIWCPYNCRPDSATPGYIIEILQAIYEPLGYEIKYSLLPWLRAINSTREGKYDMVVGAYHTDVPDFLFPENSVGISETVMARRKSIPWVYEDMRSLDDQHLAIVDGYTFGRDFQGADLDKYLDDKNNKVIKLHGDDALIRALGMIRKGLLDGVLDDRNVLTSKIIELGLDRDITVSNTISATEKIYVAFSPQLALSPERIKIFDEGLLRLRSSGALDKILHRYGLVDQ